MVQLHIYVIHYKKLETRLANIERLKALGEAAEDLTVKVHVVDSHQPSEINVNNIKNLVKLGPLEDNGTENTFYNNFVKKLSLEILSNILNHFKALQMIVKESSTCPGEDTFYVVLEDDVMYSEKVYVQIASLISYIKSMEWRIVLLGQPSDTGKQDGNKLQLQSICNEPNLLLHCCESYMIHPEMARELVMQIFPIRFAYNVQLSYMIDKYMRTHKEGVYKIFPNVFGDGSKMGNYNSSILANNVLIFNATYKDIYLKLEKQGVTLSKEDSESIEEQFRNNPFKENPDFIYLEGLYHRKQGNLGKCRDCFARVLELNDANVVPMNNGSTFLRNYIELHKFLQ